jgi:hypothetical protein
MLKDDPSMPAHLQPTRENIVSTQFVPVSRVDRLTLSLVAFSSSLSALVAPRVAASRGRRRAR